ncbi:hypothetical protein T440DRAFT_220222 [Plenodomus tracheiphilus IPT5]|uniref:Uncharacterized protein n=1 Tax=Plenodomus tracheiphilus IPT5 TaxID=1408161 RepID=A0A6A7AUU6_9PLEO|nr:hypothetical protein T440DRAFT_220222 [Plenodomus tracheiphilus IPT5]
MVLAKRYNCIIDDDGYRQCYSDDSFWYTDKGIIIKWIILITFFLVFFGWFVGGYIHAKQRLRKGLPLLAYHRFLIPYSTRRAANPPQNHFTFYQTQQNPYHSNSNQYTQRQDGAWTDPPPLYQNTDSPPQYFAPPVGATKMSPSQGGGGGVEMSGYGAPQGGQVNGVVGANTGDVEQGGSSGMQSQSQTPGLPPRPETARTKLMGVVGRFRR